MSFEINVGSAFSNARSVVAPASGMTPQLGALLLQMQGVSYVVPLAIGLLWALHLSWKSERKRWRQAFPDGNDVLQHLPICVQLRGLSSLGIVLPAARCSYLQVQVVLLLLRPCDICDQMVLPFGHTHTRYCRDLSCPSITGPRQRQSTTGRLLGKWRRA